MIELDQRYIALIAAIAKECGGKLPDKSELVPFLIGCFYSEQSQAVKECASENLAHAVEMVKCYQSQHWRN
jgi:hypothetical protein